MVPSHAQRRDVAQSELLAGLLDKLKAAKEPDGTSLFDHTALVYGSNIRSVHFLDNCPTIFAGGGAGLKLGQHLALPKSTPLCNAWLTMLHGLGIALLVARICHAVGLKKDTVQDPLRGIGAGGTLLITVIAAGALAWQFIQS